MPILTRFVIVLAISLAAVSTDGQKLHYQFTSINTDNGLANNTVTDVLQDKKGFIWIATNNGLQRFDGLRFSNWRYQLNNPRSLPSDLIGKLLEDDEQNLWVACHNGVARINKLRQPPVRIPVGDNKGEVLFQVTKFFQDSKKNIWLVTRPHGIFLFDKATNRFVSLRQRYPFIKWRNFSVTEEPGTGNYWLGGDSGLAYLDIKRHQFYNYANNPLHIPLLSDPRVVHKAILDLVIDNNRQLWFNTFSSGYPTSLSIRYDGYYYNLQTGQLTALEAPRQAVYNYALDKDRNIWLLGEDAFSVQSGNTFIHIPADFSSPFGLKAHMVYSFTEDRDHNKWIGTDKGLFVFNTEQNKMARGAAFDDNKNRLEITPEQFLELGNGKIWMGTWGEGIMEYDENFTPIRRLKFNSNEQEGVYNMVWTMVKARDGRIWMGCQSGRIMIYEPKTGRFKKLAPPEFDSKTVRTAAEDRDGNIWFGTQQGLIVKFDIATNKFIRTSAGPGQTKETVGNIHKMLVDNNNQLWVCTNVGGLLKVNTATGKVVDNFKHDENDPSSISSNGTYNIIQYSDSIFVITSTMGINFLNTSTRQITHLTTQDGLPSNTAFTLKKDGLNNIWVGLNGYLVKIVMPSKNIVVMGRKDGVFNETFQINGMELLNDGRIVAGTNDEFIYFQPRSFQSTATPPNVQITSFKVFNQEINFDSVAALGKRLWLPFNQNFVRIEFSPLGFINDNLTYYYKLEGLDKDWIRGTADLSANYANLKAGNYTFLVKCVNGDGIRTSAITSMPFLIRAPFWETWWFLFLLAIIAAATLYFFHRLRVNRLIVMQTVRSRIARDLHDDMGSTLSTINILSEMAKMKIEKDIDATKMYLAKISDNSSRMMEAMDDIVWSINPMNDNMQKITARMREYAANILEAKDIEYTFEVDEAVKNVKLDMEARRDFFLIFKEAINNLAKYSRCKHAQIKIEVYEYTMCMKIQDDGIGFVVKEADSGNGLTNMAKRAQTLNAKLNIDSKPGVGTKILLEVNFA